MWVFTKDGFFSVVENQDDGDCLMVRGRIKEDMQRLGSKFKVELRATPKADYAYRFVVPRTVWAGYIWNATMELDYDNFKAAVHGEHDRDDAYMKCWMAMSRLQARRHEMSRPFDSEDWSDG
jgi:hypothetical protein